MALGWLFVVLYPDPTMLADSVRNVRQPPVDAAAVAAVAQRLPDDPRTIERIVLDEIVPYGYDWDVSGVPWYFPTTAEALQAGRGDCESRALVLASILEAKGIPHQLRMSFDHIWVDYPGKVANALENDAVAIADQGEDGFAFRWPKDFDPWQEWVSQLGMFWVPMPMLQKVLLFAGLLLALGWNGWVALAARRLGLVPVPDLRPDRRRRRKTRRTARPAPRRAVRAGGR